MKNKMEQPEYSQVIWELWQIHENSYKRVYCKETRSYPFLSLKVVGATYRQYIIWRTELRCTGKTLKSRTIGDSALNLTCQLTMIEVIIQFLPLTVINGRSVSGCVYFSSTHGRTVPNSEGKEAAQRRISNWIMCTQWGLTIAQRWWQKTRIDRRSGHSADISCTYLCQQKWELTVVINDACWSQTWVVDVAKG